MKLVNFFCVFVFSLCLSSCSAGKYYEEAYQDNKQMTLGVAQKEIHKGMSQADVATVLGSPNIVTQDKEGNEAWIYDKLSMQARASGSQGILLYFQTGADYVARKDVSQQTLTIIIKFDQSKLVDTISYHSSKF